MGGDIGEIKLGSERELCKYINHYVVVRGRLHSTVCMARCGLRDEFVVWLCESETFEDHVLYCAKVVSRCTR